MINQYALEVKKSLTIDQLNELSGIVSRNRRQRATKFIFKGDKERCLLAGAMIRYILIKYYGFEKNGLNFGCSKNGKPYLLNSNIYFNLSHSGRWIVCAVGTSELGIDVEEIRILEYEKIYKSFSTSERRYLDSLPYYDRQKSFFKLWTLKESFVKFKGCGLALPFDSFSINFEPLGLARGSYNNKILFYSQQLSDNYWYSLCYQSDTINELEFIDLDKLLDFW